MVYLGFSSIRLSELECVVVVTKTKASDLCRQAEAIR